MSIVANSMGKLGTPWDSLDVQRWRSRQTRKRSYADDVVAQIDALRHHFDVSSYGALGYADDRYELIAVRSKSWKSQLPTALITGGVHGYETSGVHGALRFLTERALSYAGKVNLLVVPCVSPWAYERVQRWNFDAMDPNRSFRSGSGVEEAGALMRLIAPLYGQIAMHIDLHETTDSDESEFRPALAARDGKAFEPGVIPDGFYLVDDALNLQSAFQADIIQAVGRITRIAQADERGKIIGSPILAPGVIALDMKALGLCPGISGARLTSTTEVYPNSSGTTPEQCIAAQVTAICAGLDFTLAKSVSMGLRPCAD